MEHGGRFQVHGIRSIVLDSEPWNQATPLSQTQAHGLFDSLEDRVSTRFSTDHQILEKAGAFAKTRSLIERISEGGGCGPYKYTYPKPSRLDQRRVDTEIQRGRAFEPDRQE